MSLPSFFKISEKPLPEIVSLLKQTRLGTNGAQYRHLDTAQRIGQVEKPLFLYIQRQERVLGNITFSRRKMQGGENAFYIRYFAFDTSWSSSGKGIEKSGNSLLKSGLEVFFDHAFQGEYGEPADLFYAYIEPANTRSMWMAHQFSFKQRTTFVTWSFSRLFPKQVSGFMHLNKAYQSAYFDQLNETYGRHALFYPYHTEQAPHHFGIVEEGRLVCACAAHVVQWEIVRLPGKYGRTLTTLLPWVPFLRKVINPKAHRFAAIEGVVVLPGQEHRLAELFESILAVTQTHLLLSWYDQRDSELANYFGAQDRGIAKWLIPLQSAHLMTKTLEPVHEKHKPPYYISAFDLI